MQLYGGCSTIWLAAPLSQSGPPLFCPSYLSAWDLIATTRLTDYYGEYRSTSLPAFIRSGLALPEVLLLHVNATVQLQLGVLWKIPVRAIADTRTDTSHRA